MIGHISHATVYVGSQDDAKAYYTGKLGFTETSDVDMGNGIRWLTVLPPGGQTHLVLYLGGDDATKGQKPVGGWTSMVLHCADIDATYKELTANGVNMTEPSDVPWGRHAMLTDPDGNVFKRRAAARLGRTGMADESIQLYTVNGGRPSAVIPLKRYEAMRKAILKVLKSQPDGLTLHDLAKGASQELPMWWTREGWDEMWHTTGVKLHLEYIGELERVPKASPHRVRIKGAHGTAGRQAGTSATAAGKPKSPREMGEAIVRNLPQRTGRSLAEWVKVVRATGITDWSEAKNWLKENHGLSTMYAYMVAGAAIETGGPDYGDEEGLLSAMYSGAREKLRPIHDKVHAVAMKLGPDVEMVVCKTYISFRAKTQFAVVKPTTQTLVDIAVALPPDTPYTARLIPAANLGGGERNRHRFRVGSVKEVDSEVKAALKAAYEWDIRRNEKKKK